VIEPNIVRYSMNIVWGDHTILAEMLGFLNIVHIVWSGLKGCIYEYQNMRISHGMRQFLASPLSILYVLYGGNPT
jgi:hypothetical protein